ncbi:SIMPL domain-containing protein [Gordonia sp. ABSL1-1]|uniref:SIMPL domain-containing protein n=1 Tax=Gordonia sp. ABSL1-1 TaxID=3053923 RepID=UPI0025737A12|nr:SIMPL domain-containing protein [Gordonia sp. ABSL1-1]MDL9936697.1 SIMPL domain-containing protein [Gordonia sp. ABSL1-1]
MTRENLTTHRSRRHRPAAVLVGLLGAALLLAGCGDDDDHESPATPRTVTVVGSGQVSGTPDTLRATIGVEASGPDVSTALNEASTKVRAVTDAVVAAGVARADIQTQQVTLSPQYTSPAPGSSSAISGYQASNTIRIVIRDLSKASNILRVAVDAGGDNTRLSGVSFAIDDNSKLLAQARTAAFGDARSRAEQYAELADDSLGNVLSISESTSGDEQPAPAFDRVAAAPVPVEPGQQEVTFTVKVTYALN